MNRDQSFWDFFYMDVALMVSNLSRDQYMKVGAIIVKNKNIISFSYNGTAEGTDNKMRNEEGKTLPTVFHAETNAIGKLVAAGTPTIGATLYCTHSPCVHCAKAIYQAQIRRVVFLHYHDEGEGAKMLSDLGIEVKRITDGNTSGTPSASRERLLAVSTKFKELINPTSWRFEWSHKDTYS